MGPTLICSTGRDRGGELGRKVHHPLCGRFALEHQQHVGKVREEHVEELVVVVRIVERPQRLEELLVVVQSALGLVQRATYRLP